MEQDILHDDRIVDLREVPQRARVQASIEFIEHLRVDASLQLVADSSPFSIKQTIQRRHGADFEWTCINTGPKVWHARIRRHA